MYLNDTVMCQVNGTSKTAFWDNNRQRDISRRLEKQ